MKNWDATIPAAVGIIVLFRRARNDRGLITPIVWLALTIAVFSLHQPWWSYYYVHNAVPLTWCAAIGIAWAVRCAWAGKHKLQWLLVGAYVLTTLPWMGARVYLEIMSARNSPQIYNSLVIGQMEKYKPFSRFMYAEEPIYSFHAGIPMPPRLAVVCLKRFLSGDLTGPGLAAELQVAKPGMILLGNDTGERPFDDLIHAQYRIVFEDADHRLYVLRTILALETYQPQK